jgi:hypothetical protein
LRRGRKCSLKGLRNCADVGLKGCASRRGAPREPPRFAERLREKFRSRRAGCLEFPIETRFCAESRAKCVLFACLEHGFCRDSRSGASFAIGPSTRAPRPLIAKNAMNGTQLTLYARKCGDRIGVDGIPEGLGTARMDARPPLRFLDVPGPQPRGTGGTLQWAQSRLRSGPPAECVGGLPWVRAFPGLRIETRAPKESGGDEPPKTWTTRHRES